MLNSEPGKARLLVSVADLKAKFNTKGFRNQKVKLHVELRQADGADSQVEGVDREVEVLFDSQPPTLTVDGDLKTQEGQALTVSLIAEDPLSGVDKVEAALKLGEKDKLEGPILARFVSGDALKCRLELTIPKDKLMALEPGEHDLFLQATDKSGNATLTIDNKQTFIIARKPDEPKEPAASTKGSIHGVVTFDKKPQKDVEVKIGGTGSKSMKTDDKGAYRFPNLEPGDYTIEAHATIKNKARKFPSGKDPFGKEIQSDKVVVPPGKAVPKDMTLE